MQSSSEKHKDSIRSARERVSQESVLVGIIPPIYAWEKNDRTQETMAKKARNKTRKQGLLFRMLQYETTIVYHKGADMHMADTL